MLQALSSLACILKTQTSGGWLSCKSRIQKLLFLRSCKMILSWRRKTMSWRKHFLSKKFWLLNFRERWLLSKKKQGLEKKILWRATMILRKTCRSNQKLQTVWLEIWWQWFRIKPSLRLHTFLACFFSILSLVCASEF